MKHVADIDHDIMYIHLHKYLQLARDRDAKLAARGIFTHEQVVLEFILSGNNLFFYILKPLFIPSFHWFVYKKLITRNLPPLKLINSVYWTRYKLET